MNKLILSSIILILPFSTACFADQVITLKDGSQIKGDLSGIVNGVYTIKTPIIGDVHVSANDVASITNNGVPVAGAPANNMPPGGNNAPVYQGTQPNLPANIDQQIASGQQKLMSNPQSMAALQEMMQDPQIMQALQDPALVQAVTTHDYRALQNNPRLMELMNNPKMKALMQELTSQQQNPAS